MMQRRLEFERLDARELHAIVGIGTESSVSSERISVPVTIDDATGVRAAEVRLRYDPQTWSVEPAAIQSGSAWVRGGASMSKVNAEAGEITVFVFAAEELPGDQGTLVNLEFTRQDSAAESSPAIELQSVRLNEGAITASVNDEGDGDEDDYINPRVRAKLAKLAEAEAEAEPAPLAAKLAQPVMKTVREFPRISRDRSALMGPIPLTTSRARQATVESPSPQAAIASTNAPPIISWMLLVADEDMRVRRRAA